MPEPGAPLAILGGTFDPVHNGHLRVADEVRRALVIDDFRLLPAGQPPHRRHTHASATDRLAMLQLAVAGRPGLAVDDREVRRPGPSWMLLTLQSLAQENPCSPLLLVLGQDSANTLHEWHRWREILPLAHLVVITRPDEPPCYPPSLEPEMRSREVFDAALLGRRQGGLVLHLPVQALGISSTLVRQRLADGLPVDDLVPAPVLDYIRSHGLYGSARAL